MRTGTSGVLVEKKQGRISIGYVDFGVSQFGGGDFEKTYYLDIDNSKKLVCALKKQYKGKLKKMIEEAFGENFSDTKFIEFCKSNEIEYTSSTWTS